MAQPTPYVRHQNYADFQQNNPGAFVNGADLDADFDGVKVTTDQIRDRLALIQRDDGKLENASVGPDQLAAGAENIADTLTAMEAQAAAAADSADAAAASAADAAARLQGTSVTSFTVGAGSKTFTTQEGKHFDAGTFVLVASAANVANYMHGQVTAYSGASLTVNVTSAGGSGTHDDWLIFVSGTRGAQGETGPGSGDVEGPDGGVVDSEVAVFDDTTGKFLKGGGQTIAQVIAAATQNAGQVAYDNTASGLTADNVKAALDELSDRPGGKIVQTVRTQTGAVATGTTQIPLDNSIPQNTEGDEYFSRAITPANASNLLEIVVTFTGAIGAAGHISVGLFQDSVADALAASAMGVPTNTISTLTFSHRMTAGTTSETTFKVRAGSNVSATLTFNGRSSGQIFGGVMASSITIREIAA